MMWKVVPGYQLAGTDDEQSSKQRDEVCSQTQREGGEGQIAWRAGCVARATYM